MAEVTARKVRKGAPVLKPREEIALIRKLPKVQRAILILKVTAVLFFAIGLEGIVTGNWILAVVFIALGIILVAVPVELRLPTACPVCSTPLPDAVAFCPECGTPVL